MRQQIKAFVERCIAHYGECVENLPDSVQHEFAALIMSQEEDYAMEATGPDNPNWETKMLPALIRYLSNTTDKDEQIEFNNIWRDGVTEYMSIKMQDLLKEGLAYI